jgi:hypothetical protein
MRAEDGPAEMERRGPAIGLEYTPAAIRRDEVQSGLGREVMVDTDGPEEVSEIGAASHADVLTRVDELARGRVRKRSGSTAETAARFQNGHDEPSFGKRCGRGQASETAANDRDTPHAVPPASA